MFGRSAVKIREHRLQFGLQPWLETVFLIDDKEAERKSDWTVGYYHCSHCDTWQGFAHKLPPAGDVSAVAHNERNAFMRAHAHGDGRIALFEQDMPDPVATHLALNESQFKKLIEYWEQSYRLMMHGEGCPTIGSGNLFDCTCGLFDASVGISDILRVATGKPKP